MELVRALKVGAVWVAAEASRPFRKEPVCMLHVGRVGSTVLADMLGRHPELAACGEIYHAEWERILHENFFAGYRIGAAPYHPIRRSVLKTGKRTPIYEVKFLPTQHMRMMAPSLPQLIEDLQALGTRKFLILERRNSLRRAISVQAIIDSGVTHVRGADKPGRKTVHIDVASVPIDGAYVTLLEYCDQIAEAYQEVRRLTAGCATLSLSYEEDIMRDPGIAYHKCCDFLGVTPAEIPPRLSRTNPDPVSESISNFDEVAAALRGTRHEWMLAD